MKSPVRSIFDLSPAEKLQLVEDLWDDLTAKPNEVIFTTGRSKNSRAKGEPAEPTQTLSAKSSAHNAADLTIFATLQ